MNTSRRPGEFPAQLVQDSGCGGILRICGSHPFDVLQPPNCPITVTKVGVSDAGAQIRSQPLRRLPNLLFAQVSYFRPMPVFFEFPDHLEDCEFVPNGRSAVAAVLNVLDPAEFISNSFAGAGIVHASPLRPVPFRLRLVILSLHCLFYSTHA